MLNLPLRNGFRVVAKSKHASKPFEGRVRINEHSGLRKRMRAVARGFYYFMPPPASALLRHGWYRNLITTAEMENAAYAV